MSILNICPQAVGLMRSEIPYCDIEDRLKDCKKLKDIRAYAEKDDDVRKEVIESVRNVKDLLSSVFSKLSLKGKPFEMFEAAVETEMDDLFSEVLKVDSTVDRSDATALKVKNRQELLRFLDTHCVLRNYMFSVRKCNEVECTTCSPPRLPPDVFESLHNLPDPIPNGDHYAHSEQVYGQLTTEEHMPSLKEKVSKDHGMDFSPSGQTAKNTKLTIQCTQCNKWRVIHSAKALRSNVRTSIESELELILYCCGSVFSDIEESTEENVLQMVHVRRNLNSMFRGVVTTFISQLRLSFTKSAIAGIKS